MFTPDPEAPKTRADCIDGPRPCPWVSCKYHLAVDETSGGSLRRNGGTTRETDEQIVQAISEMKETCALDVAARDEDITLAEIGAMFGIGRERIRQIEMKALLFARTKTPDDILEPVPPVSISPLRID